MKRSHFQRQLQCISQMTELPPQIRDIIVDNKKMTKKITILERQIHQKCEVITQLKEQLDSTIVEQTQDRLSIMRTVERQVQDQVKDVKEKYYEKSLEMQAEIDVLRETVEELKKEVGRQVQKSVFLGNKIESLKQYILQIVEQKDHLIHELADIITDQERKISECTFCSKTAQQICQEAQTKRSRKKAPCISKNV